MPNLDDLLITLTNKLLPSAIQFTLLLFALMGSILVAMSLIGIYQMISRDQYQTSSGQTIGGSLIRILLGGLMVTPSVTLWRAADAFLQGGGTTESNILAYISDGGAAASYCLRFSNAITLTFMLVGLIGVYLGFRNIDDQARGFNPNGYRTSVPFVLGGIACFLINDIIAVASATVEYNLGFESLCAAFDAVKG